MKAKIETTVEKIKTSKLAIGAKFKSVNSNYICLIYPAHKIESFRSNFQKMREMLPDYIVTRNGFQGAGVIHIWER